jgi:hypothetical protein
MKAWLAATLGLCALVAVWALPPAELTWRARPSLPEEIRYQELASELQLEHGVLMARRWSDSLSALVVEQSGEGVALAYPPSALLTPEGVQEWRTLVDAYTASLQPRDATMKTGIIFQAESHGALPDVLGPRFGVRPQVYVGVRNGAPYCFTVHPERFPVENATLRSARTLGQCSWYAKYGSPGPAVGAWLEARGLYFARVGRVADLIPSLGPRSLEPRLPFGLDRPSAESLPVAACLAGRENACEQAVIEPAGMASAFFGDYPLLVARSPVTHVTSGASTPFARMSSYMFSELEARYGPEAFARFWTSGEAVPVAFQEAFGSELGGWVQDWFENEVGVFRAGPAPRARTLAWALLLVTALSAIAVTTQARRRAA